MARRCTITGKRARTGHKVSHSNIKSLRRFHPNVHTKRLLNPATGTMMKVTLSTSALRTLAKWQASGKRYDLRTLVRVS